MSALVPLIVARNPATGAELGRHAWSLEAEVARQAEGLGARFRAEGAPAWGDRLEGLRRWAKILAGSADAWSELISAEIGKPRVEAMIEVVTTLDALRWTIRHARGVLRDWKVGAGFQRGLLMRGARVRWIPRGVVGLIGTWNYPLLLNAAPVAQALAAGNRVIWKPSELATACGMQMHADLEAAGLAPERVATVVGGGPVGQALTSSDLDMCVFTGGIEAGRAVLSALGGHGVPAIAELSGFDAAVVLPDAEVGSTARSLAWGSFVGAGQTCIAIKRVYVTDRVEEWGSALGSIAGSLRVGDPAGGEVEMGPLISETARARFHARIEKARGVGARVLSGGRAIAGPGSFYEPTVLLATGAEEERVLAGVFGPVVLLRQVADVDAAIEAANAGAFGLAASVWGRDRRRLREVAARLRAGMVTINDAVTPAGHAAAPFGGIKASGYGRTRGGLGLLEFASAQAVHARGPGGWRPQLFPYTGTLMKLLGMYRKWVHRG